MKYFDGKAFDLKMRLFFSNLNLMFVVKDSASLATCKIISQ